MKVNNHKAVRIWTYDGVVAVLCPKVQEWCIMKVNNHKVNNHKVVRIWTYDGVVAVLCPKVQEWYIMKVNNHKVVRIWTYDGKVAVLCQKGWKYSSKTGWFWLELDTKQQNEVIMSKDQVDFGHKRSRKPEYVQWQLLILSNTVKCSQVTSRTAKYSQIQLSAVRYRQEQPRTAKNSQIQPSTVKYCQVQSRTVKNS